MTNSYSSSAWNSAGGAFIGGLFSLGGLALSNSMNMHNAKELALLQHELAKQYAEYTGTHAHQWEVSDLRNAGLNPILSANSGQTYSGSSGFGSGAPTINTNPGKEALESALSVRSTMANLENMSANTQKQKSESNLIDEQTHTQKLLTDYQSTVNTIADLEKQLKEFSLPYDKKNVIQNALSKEYENLEILSRIRLNDNSIDLMKSTQSLNDAQKVFYTKTGLANELNAKTNATWTPAKVGVGIASGLVGYGLSRLGLPKSLGNKKLKLGNPKAYFDY